MTLVDGSPGDRDEDPALLRRVNAGQRVEQRGLAGAVRSDRRRGSRRGHAQRDVVSQARRLRRSAGDALDVEDDPCGLPPSPGSSSRSSRHHALPKPPRDCLAIFRRTFNSDSVSSALRRRAGKGQRSEDHHEDEQRADPDLPVRSRYLVLKELRQPREDGRAGDRPGSEPIPPNTTYATTRIELFRMKLSGLK